MLTASAVAGFATPVRREARNAHHRSIVWAGDCPPHVCNAVLITTDVPRLLRVAMRQVVRILLQSIPLPKASVSILFCGKILAC